MNISKLFTFPVLFFLLVAPAFAVELVILGRVLDAGGSGVDQPIFGVTVKLFNERNVQIGSALTNGKGYYSFPFESASVLTGKEHARIEMAGYSRLPTLLLIKLTRSTGEKFAYQNDVLLANEESIRASPLYRKQVAQNIIQAVVSGNNKEGVYPYYISLAGLPQPAKGLVFEELKERSGPAYSELVGVDLEFTNASKLENYFRTNSSNIEIVPYYGLGGRTRFSGTVSTQKEMEIVLLQAKLKGFGGNKIINDMQVLMSPDKSKYIR